MISVSKMLGMRSIFKHTHVSLTQQNSEYCGFAARYSKMVFWTIRLDHPIVELISISTRPALSYLDRIG